MLELPPISLYIHYPWCVKKCPYCDFNSHDGEIQSGYIKALLKDLDNLSANICLPLLHTWLDEPRIDNLVIISNPDDAERICKYHIKKAPIFKFKAH